MYIRMLGVVIFTLVFTIHAQDIKKNEEADARLFLSTFTVILSTVTSTTTIGTTTTCTTSSSAMPACSAKARRRRGILFDEDKQVLARRGLFYNEDEEDLNEGSVSVNKVKRSANHTKSDTASSAVTIDDTNLIPLTIQSGFSLPDSFSTGGAPRFKLAYGTSTIITTATSVATRSLIIFCNSITNYPTCSGTPITG